MTISSLLRGSVRHTGYAFFCLAILSAFIERALSGFVTPYFNPYAVASMALVLSLFGAWDVVGSRRGRWFVGVVCVTGLSVWLYLSFDFEKVSVLLLGIIGLLVAFFLTSVYAEDL